MITVKRTNSDNIDFQKLAKELDESLKMYYREETLFYEKLNKIESIKCVIVIYDANNNAIGCGGIKAYSQDEAEIKRMYVSNVNRGKGMATIILSELEKWSYEMNFKKCILETLKQKEYAINFYKKNNYKIISNFGEYKNAERSICFGKIIKN